MTIDEVKRELFSSSEDVLGNDMVDLYEAQECCDTSFNIGYNKAIDDFANGISGCLGVENATKYSKKNAEQQGTSYDTLMKYENADAIEDVAEELKAGEMNEMQK